MSQIVFKIPIQQQEDLNLLLTQLSFQQQKQFTQIAMDFLLKTQTQQQQLRLFQSAGSMLKVPYQDIEKNVKGLSYLFINAARRKCNTNIFDLSVQSLKGLTKEFKELLCKTYEDNYQVLRELCRREEDVTGIIPQMESLSWRLDVELASRNQEDQIKPKYTMALKLQNGNKFYFHTDYEELKKMTKKVNRALKETKSTHARRVRHFIK